MTAGHMRLVAAESAARLARSETAAFLRLYKKASIDLGVSNTRGALAELFGARADAIVIPRDISPEEDSLARVNHLGLQGFRLGVGGLALIVNPANPVNQVALDQLRAIYTAQAHGWAELGGAERPIQVLWKDPNTGSYEQLVEKVLAGKPPQLPSAWIKTDAEMVAEVARRPDAIGFVSSEALGPGVKALKVSEARGFPYYSPDPENLWNQKYPLRYFFVIVYRRPVTRVVEGFTTFALSTEGQRVVRDAGQVPTAVPIRIHRP